MLPYTAVDLIRSMTVIAASPERTTPRSALRSLLVGFVTRH